MAKPTSFPSFTCAWNKCLLQLLHGLLTKVRILETGIKTASILPFRVIYVALLEKKVRLETELPTVY